MIERLTVMPSQPLSIVCCFIFDDKNRILLLRRHPEDFGGGLWAVPGGKQEPDEAPRLTALREVKEETGIDLDEIGFLGTHEMRMPHGIVHMKAFKALVDGERIVTIDPEEHDDHHWFAVDELLHEDSIIWGLPTQLLDFGIIEPFDTDPTLTDGSQAVLLKFGDE
jgi:8-oxo-dGTP diphosphatase